MTNSLFSILRRPDGILSKLVFNTDLSAYLSQDSFCIRRLNDTVPQRRVQTLGGRVRLCQERQSCRLAVVDRSSEISAKASSVLLGQPEICGCLIDYGS
jgi:hypothetical protein